MGHPTSSVPHSLPLHNQFCHDQEEHNPLSWSQQNILQGEKPRDDYCSVSTRFVPLLQQLSIGRGLELCTAVIYLCFEMLKVAVICLFSFNSFMLQGYHTFQEATLLNIKKIIALAML